MIPRDLVEKMNSARYFSLGMDDMRQLGLTNISLQYYLRPAPANLGETARATTPSTTCSRRRPSRSSRTRSAISAATARLITPIAGRS